MYTNKPQVKALSPFGGIRMDKKTEGELLLYCLGIGTDETRAAKLEKLSTSDWDGVIQQSSSVTPLLYQRLRTLSPSANIPGSVVQKLRERYLHNLERNTCLYHELSKVLRILQNNGIPVIVLKGAALAELIYQDIALRPMRDVDLLVKGKDIWRIDKVLSQLGYESEPILSKHHAQWGRHISYRNRVIHVEIHPRIMDLPNLNAWINASPAKIASTDTLILGAEDFLLHLCLHVDSHLRGIRGVPISTKLIWFIDISAVLEHYRKELNWDYVIRIAKKHQVEGAIHRIVNVINEWFDGHVPANVLSQLKDDGIIITINDVLHYAKKSKKSEPKQALTQNRELESLLSSISGIPSSHNKIYHVFRSIFPCREFMIHRYSVTRPNCVYFYYFIRISDVAIKAVKALYQLPHYLKNKHASLRT